MTRNALLTVLLAFLLAFTAPVAASHSGGARHINGDGLPDPDAEGEVLFLRPNGTAYNPTVPNPPAIPYAQVFGSGAAVLIQVTDSDLTDDVEEVQVVGSSDDSGVFVELSRIEQGLPNGVYRGYIGFETTQVNGNGLLYVQDGDTVSVIYEDDENAADQASVHEDFLTWRKGTNGQLILNDAAYHGTDAVVDVQVLDDDLQFFLDDPTSLDVRVTSDSDDDGFVLELSRTSPGVYEGSFAFAAGTSAVSDGSAVPLPLLAVDDGDRFKVAYEDEGVDARGRDETPSATSAWHRSHTGIVQWTTLDRREVMDDPVLYGLGEPTTKEAAQGWIRVEDRDRRGDGTISVNVRSFVGTSSASPSEVDPSGINVELKETGADTGEFVGHIGFIRHAPSDDAKDRLRVDHDARVSIVYTDPVDEEGDLTEISANATWQHRALHFIPTATLADAPATSVAAGYDPDGCTAGGNGDVGCRPTRGFLRFEAPDWPDPAQATARLVSTRDPMGVDVTLDRVSGTDFYLGSFAFHHPGSHPEGEGPADHLDDPSTPTVDEAVAGIWAVKNDKLNAYVVNASRSTTGGLHLFQAQEVSVTTGTGLLDDTAAASHSTAAVRFTKGADTTVARDRPFFGPMSGTIAGHLFVDDRNANQKTGAKDSVSAYLGGLLMPNQWSFGQTMTPLGHDMFWFDDANGNGDRDFNETVFLSMSGSPGVGDIIVGTEFSSSYGDVVTAGHANATGFTFMPLGAAFGYVDDGDGVPDEGDTMVLVNGTTTSDSTIRLSGSGAGKNLSSTSTLAGKSYSALPELSVLHDDADGSADFEPADEHVFIDVDLSGHRSRGDLYIAGPSAGTIESARDVFAGAITGGLAESTLVETTSTSGVFRDEIVMPGSPHGETYCLHELHRASSGVPAKVLQSPCLRWYEEREGDGQAFRSDAFTALIEFRNASHQGAAFGGLDPVAGLRTLWVAVRDPDIRTDGADEAGEVTVRLRSSSDNVGIDVKLKERYGHHGLANDNVAWGGVGGSTVDDRYYIGSFRFTLDASGSGALKVKDGDVVSASYDDPADNSGGALTPVARVQWFERSDATIEFDREFYRHEGTGALRTDTPLRLVVRDLDRNLNNANQDTLNVVVESEDAGDSVLVTLTEDAPRSGVFRGEFRTERQLNIDRGLGSATAGDLAVYDEDTITATYVDVGANGQTVDRTDTARWYDQTAARLLLNKTTYAGYGDQAEIRLEDPDLDIQSDRDEVRVFVTSDSDGIGERILLTETGDRTGVFIGGFGFESSASRGNGALAVKDGDRFVVHHLDTERTGDNANDDLTGKQAIGFWDLMANVPPTITVTTEPALDATGGVTIAPGDEVVFKIVLDDVDGTVASWRVDFGDDSTPVTSSSSGAAIPASLPHLYAEAGIYTVEINATDEDGATATRSITVTVDTGDVDDPGDIDDLRVTLAGKTKAVLQWTAPENNQNASDGRPVDGYVVKVASTSITSEAAFASASVVPSADLTFDPATLVGPEQTQRLTIRGLEPGATYVFAVRARDAGGNVGGFDTANATTTLVDGTPPVGTLNIRSSHVEGERSTDRDITFSWSAATDDESDVTYHWLLNGNAATTLNRDIAPGESVTTTSFSNQEDGTYYFHLIACSESVCATGNAETYGPIVIGEVPDAGPTRDDVIKALQDIKTTVSRDGDANVVAWTLPGAPEPLGVLIWVNEGDGWTRLVDLPAGDPAFEAGEYRHEGAPADAQYIVTSYYGTTADLGFASEPDDVPGFDTLNAASAPAEPEEGWPAWLLPALIGLGVLLLVLVVVVAIVVSRGRGQADEDDESMAWTEAEPGQDTWGEESSDAWGEEATEDAWGEPAEDAWNEDIQEPEAPPGAEPMDAPEELPPAHDDLGPGAVVPGEAYEPEPDPFDPDLHHLTCPSCSADFTASGPKPLVTECPSCGVRGILR